MTHIPSSGTQGTGSLPAEGAPAFVGQKGNVLFYILIAIGLFASLTYAFVNDGQQNVSAQLGYKTSEELFIQSSLIRAAIEECKIQYPGGGGDITGDGNITTADNFNPPYPVEPDHPNNPHGVAANKNVRLLSCTGAPAGSANFFQGVNNKGRFLPPPPTDFGEWQYLNDANGVRIRITSTGANADALTRVMTKFAACQADLNYGGCGAQCLTVWLIRTACP